MKTCSKCRKTKQINNFCKNKRMEDGINTVCRECNTEYKKIYYAKNSEQIKSEKVEYRKHAQEQRGEYLKKNKDKIKQQQKEYYENHKDQILSQRKKPDAKVARVNADSKRRDMKLYSSDGTIPNDSRDYPKSQSLIELKAAQKDRCYICNAILDYDAPFAVHLDHVIPLSKGGLHTLSNVAWSCKTCNLEKGVDI